MKMSLEAQRETLCMQRGGKQVSIERSERTCVNCAWYDQYYHKGRGGFQVWVPTSTGYCLLHECRRGALRQACPHYTTLYTTDEGGTYDEEG